jgi:ubiquinone biosynthesis monooxygenase Coq7
MKNNISMQKIYSFLDKIIIEADHAFKTVFNPPEKSSTRNNPAKKILDEENLSTQDTQKIIGYMRVNHTGEICAQALYRGQALIAKSNLTRNDLLNSANEEQDHLHWCYQRVTELNGSTSILNPFWYFGSFIIGSTAALISDEISYGFIIETEHQVMSHLNKHLKNLPKEDKKSQAILSQMYLDEAKHAQHAKIKGGKRLPFLIRLGMRSHSKIMTSIAYRI